MKHFSFILLLLSITIQSFAQSHSSGAWVEGSVSSDLVSDTLSIELGTEIKFQQFGTPLKSIAGELGVFYQISNPLSLGVTYKLTEKNKGNYFSPVHTISANIGYKQKIGDFKISYRNKFEISRDMYINEETDLLPNFEDRNKIKVQYGKKKALILPSVSIESFNSIAYSTIYSISEMRYSCGLDFNLKKKFEFGIGYLYKVSYSNLFNETTSILNLSLSKSL